MAHRTGPASSRLFPTMGDATRGVLFHGVAGGPEVPRDPAAWRRDLEAIVRERLAGLALHAVDAGGLDLDADLLASLRRAHLVNVAEARVAEAWAPDVMHSLERVGVLSVIVKGPGIARAYADPSLRTFEDIDILVPPERFQLAMRVLDGLGFRSGEPARGRYLVWCKEGVGLERPGGPSIDLHQRIQPWIWGHRLSFADILSRSTQAVLPRGVVRLAHPAHNLLIAALQLAGLRAKPSDKLKTWRDLVELSGACDPRDAAAEAIGVGLDWYLAFMLRELPSYARPQRLLAQLGMARPRRRDAFRLRRLLPPAFGSRHFTVGRLFRLPLRNSLLCLAAKLVPSRRFVRARYGSKWAYPAWWKESLDHLRQAWTGRT